MTDQTIERERTTEAICPYPGCGRPIGDGHIHNSTEPTKAGQAN